MKLTARQLVVRSRETAALLIHVLDRDRLVARFVDTYAVEFERPVCTTYAGQYLETLTNIRREALLAMTLWMEHELPRILHANSRKIRPAARRKHRAARPKRLRQKETHEHDLMIFHGEFQAALAQAMEWGPAETEEFQRDLRFYRKLGATVAAPSASRQLAARVEGPFVDRCGVLLDPSMLDKARLASARFQNQLHLTTQTILKKVFSRSREN